MRNHKGLALLTAGCIGIGCLAIGSAWNSVQGAEILDTTYTLSVVPERTTVSAAEIAAGNVTIPCKVYISGDADGTFSVALLRCKTSSNQLYFRNLTNPNTKTAEEQTYTYSGGTFSTKFLPYCFGKVSTKGTYTTNCFLPSASDIANEPKFGAELYSDGNGGVYFTITYYTGYEKDADGNYVKTSTGQYKRTGKTTETKYCDVTVDEDGTGHYSFTYIDQSYFTEQTCEATIPHFDASLPKGTAIPGTNDTLSWYSGDVVNGSGFLGESNEFPYMQMDLILQQGTEAGTYTVSFDEDYCKLNKINSTYYTLAYESAQITVEEAPSVTVTSASLPETLYWDASDDAITPGTVYAGQEGTQIMGELTQADGTVETVDLTDLVCGDGTTGAQIYEQQEGGYATAELPLYYAGQALVDADGNPITQKVVVAKRGDVNLDGEVTLADATLVLTYYSEHAINNTYWFQGDISEEPELETLAYFLADVNTQSQDYGADGGSIELSDATLILTYYSEYSVGNHPRWENLIS